MSDAALDTHADIPLRTAGMLSHLVEYFYAPSHKRAVGLLERYHITRGEVGFDSCVIVSARYAAQTTLSKPSIYGALKYAIEHQVNLGVQVDASSEPRYLRLPTVDLSRIVTIAVEPQPLQDVFSAQLLSTFQLGSDAPLWRLTVLPDNTVVFAYHHAIADGQSGLAFHRTFLDGLNQVSNPLQEPEDVISVPVNLSMELPTEKSTDTSLSIGTFFHVLFNLLAPSSWTAGASAWTANPVIKQPSLITNVHLWEARPEDTATFLHLCKSHGTTLTGALHTLSILVISRLLMTIEHSKRYKTISTSVPVSLRRFTGAPATAMCDQVSAIYSYVPFLHPSPGGRPRDTFPWEMSAQFSDKLRNNMAKSREVIGTIKYLYKLGISERFFLDKLGKKRDMTLELSNVGRFFETAVEDPDRATQLGWKIGSMYFVQCDAVYGAAIKLNVVGSPSRTLNIGFTWAPGSVDDAIADAFISGFKSEFLSLVTQGVEGKIGQCN